LVTPRTDYVPRHGPRPGNAAYPVIGPALAIGPRAVDESALMPIPNWEDGRIATQSLPNYHRAMATSMLVGVRPMLSAIAQAILPVATATARVSSVECLRFCELGGARSRIEETAAGAKKFCRS
jgi:hypothetical protein